MSIRKTQNRGRALVESSIETERDAIQEEEVSGYLCPSRPVTEDVRSSHDRIEYERQAIKRIEGLFSEKEKSYWSHAETLFQPKTVSRDDLEACMLAFEFDFVELICRDFGCIKDVDFQRGTPENYRENAVRIMESQRNVLMAFAESKGIDSELVKGGADISIDIVSNRIGLVDFIQDCKSQDSRNDFEQLVIVLQAKVRAINAETPLSTEIHSPKSEQVEHLRRYVECFEEAVGKAYGSTEEGEIVVDDSRSTSKRANSMSRLKAQQAYDYAMGNIPGADVMTARKLFGAIKEDGEVAEFLPPTAETFTKYLNDSGIRLKKRGPKEAGRSVVRPSDL